MNNPFQHREARAALDELLANPNTPKSDKKRALYERYLGALMQVVAIRNKAGLVVGYREGFTKGRLEVLARQYAKQALMAGVNPYVMSQALAEGLKKDEALGRAFMAGWTKEEKDAEKTESSLARPVR